MVDNPEILSQQDSKEKVVVLLHCKLRIWTIPQLNGNMNQVFFTNPKERLSQELERRLALFIELKMLKQEEDLEEEGTKENQENSNSPRHLRNKREATLEVNVSQELEFQTM